MLELSDTFNLVGKTCMERTQAEVGVVKHVQLIRFSKPEVPKAAPPELRPLHNRVLTIHECHAPKSAVCSGESVAVYLLCFMMCSSSEGMDGIGMCQLE
jgi:hypothetical protein